MRNRLRFIPTLLLALTTLLSLPHTAMSAGRLALVVGNADYPGKLKLNCPVRDAEAVAAWLLEVGYDKKQVRLIKNATSQELRAALKQLIADATRLRPEQVTIYYSGHGTTIADSDGDEKRHDPNGLDLTDEALLCVFDPKKVGSKQDALLLDDEFFEFIDALSGQTNQLMVFMDACFSGGIFRDAKLPDGTVERRNTKFVSEGALQSLLAASNNQLPGLRPDFRTRGVVVEKGGPGELKLRGNGRMLFVTAASENQEAVDGYPGGMSEFTRHFLHAVRSEGSDTRSLEDVSKHVSKQLSQWKQNPVFMTHNLSSDIPLLPELFPRQPPSIIGLRWRILSRTSTRILAVPENHVHTTGDSFLLEVETSPAQWLYLIYVDEQGAGTILEVAGTDRATTLQTSVAKSVRLPTGVGSRFRLTSEPGSGEKVIRDRFRLVSTLRPLNLSAADYLKLPALGLQPVQIASGASLSQTMQQLETAGLIKAGVNAHLQVSAPQASQDVILSGEAGKLPAVVVDFTIQHQANKK